MAHVVGYVGMAAKGEVDEDPVTRRAGLPHRQDRTGKGFRPRAQGTPGSISYEVDAHGRVVRELGATPSTPGKDVVLTLDHELQDDGVTRLASQRRASLVALDAVTGAVLVMASTPTFDPNEIAFKRRSQALAGAD